MIPRIFISLIFVFSLAGNQPRPIPSPQVVQAIKTASIFSNSLERTIPTPPDKRVARKVIFQHYSQGFSSAIAKRLTDYSLDSETGLPKDHDISLAPPDPNTISIIRFSPGKVVISYRTPQELIDAWEFKAFTIETLEQKNGRWIITHSKNSDKLPNP